MTVGIKLPGTSGNYVSTPDHTNFQFTSDLCLVAYVAADDWTPTGDGTIIGNFSPVSNTKVVYLGIAATTGYPAIVWSNDGTASKVLISDTAPTVADGEPIWLAATLDVDDGAGDCSGKFWTSSDGISWSQLGTTQLLGSTSVVSGDSGSDMTIGRRSGSDSQFFAGNYYYAAVYSGIGANTEPGQGTLVAEFTAEDCGDRYRDSTGKIWTVNGSAVSTVIT